MLPFALMAAAPLAAQRGEPASTCAPSGAALHVRVTGFKNGNGTVRIQAYGPNPADFLAKGKWIGREEVQLQGRRSLDICLRLPRPGLYAVAVRHDANVNGKSDWSDGAGFSRNPKLSLLHLKPSFDRVAISVGTTPSLVPVTMNYRHGFSIGPQSDVDL